MAGSLSQRLCLAWLTITSMSHDFAPSDRPSNDFGNRSSAAGARFAPTAADRATRWTMYGLGVEEGVVTGPIWFAAAQRVTALRAARWTGCGGIGSRAGGLRRGRPAFSSGWAKRLRSGRPPELLPEAVRNSRTRTDSSVASPLDVVKEAGDGWCFRNEGTGERQRHNSVIVGASGGFTFAVFFVLESAELVADDA